MVQRWKNDKTKPLWEKKTGGGLRLRQNRERIKPGQRIRATREELGRYIGEFELIETPTKSKSKKSSEPRQIPNVPKEERSQTVEGTDKKETGKRKSNESTLGSSKNLGE